MSYFHMTSHGCSVAIRNVGPSVEIVIRQKDGRTATYACSWRDADMISSLLRNAAAIAAMEQEP